MNVEKAVDRLITSKEQRPRVKARFRFYWAGIGVFFVFMVLMLTLVLPAWDRRFDFLNIFGSDVDGLSVGDGSVSPFIYDFVKSTKIGGMDKWVLNKTVVKEWLKDNFFWRLQASPDNVTWYDANQLLRVGLDWNDSFMGYKITLTLNTSDAPQSLFYRFDLACNSSLRDYFVNSSKSYWQISIPTDEGRDVNVFMNWSDIVPLVHSGKIWYDYGKKTVNGEDYIWFRIQTVNKVDVGKVFVVDPTIGAIANAVVDSFEFEPTQASMTDAVRIGSSNYYLTTWYSSSARVWARTLEAWSSNGSIRHSNVSSLQISTDYSTYNDICPDPVYVNGNEYIYAIAGYIVGSVAGVKTIKVWSNNGTIKSTIIDSQALSFACSPISITSLGNGVHAIAYAGSSVRGILETVYIDDTGQISAVNDSEKFNISINGVWDLDTITIDSDTIMIYYSGYSTGSDDGYVCTHNISSAGIISGGFSGGNKSDEWEFDPVYNRRGSLTHINGTTYAISGYGFAGVAIDGWIYTFNVSDNGMFTKSLIDTYNFETADYGQYCKLAFIEDDLYAITYTEGTSGDGWVKTLNITDAGIIGTTIDSLEFDGADNTWYAPLMEVGNDFFIIVYSGTSNDGMACTINITTPYAEEPTNNAPTSTYFGAWNSTTTTEWEFNATGVSLTPDTLNMSHADPDGDLQNWTMYHNDSGTWKVIASGANSPNATNTTTNTSWINQYSHNYSVSANITDGTAWCNHTRWFVTESAPPVGGFATNLTLDGLTPDWNVTWNGSIPSVGVNRTFCNSSGIEFETVELDIVVNDTMWVNNITFWAMWLNDTINNTQIYADNVTVWVSDDNATWGVLQCDVGYGMGVFPHTMGYLFWNWTTSPAGVEPFTYVPTKGYIIASNTTLYVRYQLNITTSASAGLYQNITPWEISIVNETGIGVIDSESLTCQAEVEALPSVISWHTIQTIGGSITNSTGWRTIQTISGSITNSTGWRTVQTLSGVITNSTGWRTIQTLSGIITNDTGWRTIQTLNGTIFNTSAVAWQTIQILSGSITNDTGWRTIQTLSGIITNDTGWTTIQTINGTIFNSSAILGEIVITSVYPNNTYVSINEIVLRVSVYHTNGSLMNLRWRYNNSGTWVTLNNLTNVGNGTYGYYPTGIFVFTNYTYQWNITANSTGYANVSRNCTFITTDISNNVIGDSNTYALVGLIGILGLIGWIMRKKNKNGGNM